MAVWVPSRDGCSSTSPRRAAARPEAPSSRSRSRPRSSTARPSYSYFNGPPELTIPDPRCENGYNQPWDVHNNADETAGTMNLIDATAYSVNTIFAQLVSQVGPDAVVRMAHRLGIESDLKPFCSITLGTQAVSPLEMTAAYATFADRGVRHDPQAVESVRTANGSLLPYPARSRKSPSRSRSPTKSPTHSKPSLQKGTGTGAAIDRPIAGKTGTAENYVDAWFCGYVPQLVTCVWVGYPHREQSMNYVEGYAPVYGGTIPAAIWHDFMNSAVAKTPIQDFVTPEIAQPSYTYSQPSYTPSTTTTYTTTTTATTTTTTH